MADLARSLSERHHALDVAAGLYLLRYVGAPFASTHPRITVNQHPHNREITLVPQPGCSDTLEAPGDCIVVRANASGSLSFVVACDRRDSEAEVEVRLEHLSSRSKQAKSAFAMPVSLSERADSHDIRVLAHVSQRGDISASAGEWICGPNLPLPIEGIEIRWPSMPAGVQLHYSAASARLGIKREATAGRFAGTRGKAGSLTALDLSLSGPNSARYELSGQAVFLGSGIITRTGRKLSFAAPSGREPLVGLRLEVKASQANVLEQATSLHHRQQRQANPVRVYRSAAGSMAAVNQA